MLVWDFTCCDTLAPSNLQVSAMGPGKVAAKAEEAKLVKYANLAESFIVAPICIETFGTWGPHGLGLVKEVGSLIARETNEPRSTSFLLQSMSMAVQRGNAVSVLGTVPASHNLEEVFYV